MAASAPGCAAPVRAQTVANSAPGDYAFKIRLPQRCLAFGTTVLHKDYSCKSGWRQSDRARMSRALKSSPCIRRFCCLVRLASTVATRCSAICNFLSVVFSASASAGVSRSALSSVAALQTLHPNSFRDVSQSSDLVCCLAQSASRASTKLLAHQLARRHHQLTRCNLDLPRIARR